MEESFPQWAAHYQEIPVSYPLPNGPCIIKAFW